MFTAILAAALSVGVLACPLWMELTPPAAAPASDCEHFEGCPPAVCQVSSPYLASQVTTDAGPLAELHAQPVNLRDSWPVLARIGILTAHDGAPSPPGDPLFLRIQSLLI